MLSTLLMLSTLQSASPTMYIPKETAGVFYSQHTGYYFPLDSSSTPRLSNTWSSDSYISDLEKLRAVERLATAKREIEKLAETASEDDWDGEGASKVSSKTSKIALRFVDLIPRDVVGDDLEIDATPFGSIDFEWVLDRDVMLNVIVLSSGEIGFAYSVHGERENGKELWGGILPEPISEAFDRVFNRKGLDG